MDRLKLKLKKGLTNSLKFVAKIFATELVKIYILPAIGVISLVGLFVYTREFLFNLLLSPIIILPEKLLVYHILLIFLIITSLLYFFFKIKKLLKPKYYYFIEEGGFKWRVSKNTGEVKKSPFCIKHQVELVNDSRGVVGYKGSVLNFYCDYCKEIVAQNVKDVTIDSIYNKVKRIVEAKQSGYAKI